MTDDITFCLDECDRKDCFRHPSQMQEPWLPHSMAHLKNSGYCPRDAEPIQPPTIDPSDEFFQTVLICAVRYCIGREMYIMPGLVTGWIVGHMSGRLSRDTLNVMKRDIDEMPVERRGMDCYRVTWARFREWLEEEGNDGKTD